jgi:hypothetical protein
VPFHHDGIGRGGLRFHVHTVSCQDRSFVCKSDPADVAVLMEDGIIVLQLVAGNDGGAELFHRPSFRTMLLNEAETGFVEDLILPVHGRTVSRVSIAET